MTYVLPAAVALVALQRAVELAYASRNTKRLLARGAIEVAPGQHPFFVALHAAWLLALLLAVPWAAPPNWALLGVFFLLQCARIWVIRALGPFWTTRVLTLESAPLVRSGPYRFMRHPNYAIVALEIAVLPLAFGAWAVAAAFTAANAALLAWRIREEDRALKRREGKLNLDAG